MAPKGEWGIVGFRIGCEEGIGAIDIGEEKSYHNELALGVEIGPLTLTIGIRARFRLDHVGENLECQT